MTATGNDLIKTEGIENLQRHVTHSRTARSNTRGFGDLSYIVNDETCVALMMGTFRSFQIRTIPARRPRMRRAV